MKLKLNGLNIIKVESIEITTHNKADIVSENENEIINVEIRKPLRDDPVIKISTSEKMGNYPQVNVIVKKQNSNGKWETELESGSND